MKQLTLLALCAALLSSPAMAQQSEGYVRMADKGLSVGVSPSGAQVFGYDGRSGEDSQSTWMYDTDTQTTTYLTKCTETEAGGQALWANSAGTLVGTLRDAEWLAPCINDGNGGVIEDYPLNTACIWKNGSLLKLDHNRWADPADFVAQDGTLPNANNGFYAMCITEDESSVVGYLKAFTYMLPVRWTKGADGQYVSNMLFREVGVFFFQWVGASADCKRIVMNTSQSGGASYIWNSDDTYEMFEYQESGAKITGEVLTALSPSGRYAIMNCERDGKTAHGVYDFDTQTVRWIPLPEGAASSNWFAANVVTDRGDGFICDYNYQLHYFNVDLGINIPMHSYLEAFGTGLDGSALSKSLVRMVSEDGRTICGNTLRNSLEQAGWIVRLPDVTPMLFALKNCEAMYVSTEEVLLKWEKPAVSVERYMAQIDDAEPIALQPVEGEDGMVRATIPCAAGEHNITLYAVAKDKDGKEWESAHQTLAVSISPETSLFFFEDLDDSEIDTSVMAYLYVHDTFQPMPSTDSRTLTFHLDAGDFYNLTPFWYTCGFATTEWHTYMESRWFDASDCGEDFFFTWQERNMPINNAIKHVASNRFVLECTTDGENWTSLHESNGASNGGNWNVRVVDLSELKGQKFRLRFHAIGGGEQACEWRVDFYGIMPASGLYQAPQGLMVTSETSKEVKLAWKNNRGEYEVSYNFNSPMTYNQNVGNEGKPLYVGCDYTPTKLKAFVGKYITSVSTMLYEPSWVGQEQHTTVQAVVFDQDGNELSRGTMADSMPWYDDAEAPIMPNQYIDLDTPVKIEADKTYRVAILITNYEPEMNPIWYFSASDDYIAGVTDLYSDDDLKTWNSFSKYCRNIYPSQEDFNLYGRCIFNVRPGISDTPEIETKDYEQSQWFYQVFKNGELLPQGISYYTHLSATDSNTGDAVYTVQSYRRDGTASQVSEPLSFISTGIGAVSVDADTQISLQPTGNGYVVAGDFDSVAIYNAMGIKVSASRVVDASALPRGVYIVTATKNGKTTSCKITL